MTEIIDHPGALDYHKKILKKQKKKSSKIRNENVKKQTMYGYLTPKQYLHFNHPNSRILAKRGLSLTVNDDSEEDL